MEIVTAPYRPAQPGWSRVLLVVGVLAPVTLLALLPIGLGFDRFVITGDAMAPALQRGTVVLERSVPVTDLRVGDVVTYPVGSATVTSRIVEIGDGEARTQGDAQTRPERWPLRLDEPSQDRVVLAVPYVGYLFLWLVQPGWAGPAVVLLGLLGLALATVQGRHRHGRTP